VLIVPAFGRGVRTGEDKLWADACGRPVFAITLEAIAAAGCFDLVVIAAPRARWETIRGLLITNELPPLVIIEGGESRQDSVAAALDRCDGHDWISVHDAARPLAPPGLFRAVLDAARAEGAATAGVPCVDTVKQVQHGRVAATLDRTSLIAAQTPQAFSADLLRRAHRRAAANGIEAGDDATLVEALGEPVAVVAGDPRNFKITFPQDLVLLRSLLEESR
jgi:2-C-methyl-D-erythritol 4-phosphate cytidylyltransferase